MGRQTDSGCLEGRAAPGAARLAGGGSGGALGGRGEALELAGDPGVAHAFEAGEDAVDLADDEDAEEGADEAFQQVVREGESRRVVAGGCGGVLGLFGCE